MSIKKLNFLKNVSRVVCDSLFKETLFKKEDPANKNLMYKIASLDRSAFAAQVELGILPLKKSLDTYKCAILLGSMGIGKTTIGYETAYLKAIEEKNPKKRKILFLTAGGKHLPNMKSEAEKIFGTKAVIKIINNKTRYDKYPKGEIIPEDVYDDVAEEGQVIVYLMSKDAGKMDLKEENIYNYGDRCPSCNTRMYPKSWKKGMVVSTRTKPQSCPSCDTSLLTIVGKNICQHSVDENKVPITRKHFNMLVLDEEGNPKRNEDDSFVTTPSYSDGLFPARIRAQYKSGSRKISVGKRFRRMQKNFSDKIFSTLLVDEVHEMQSGTSLQGIFYRDLVNVSENTLIMTGTLSNGYSSSVFFILQAILPKYFKDHGYGYKDVFRFVENFGARKTTKARDIVKVSGSKVEIKIQELPKINDAIVNLLAPFTVWIQMEDLNLKMPKYTERAIITPIDNDLLVTLNEYKAGALDLLHKHNPKLAKSFASRFLYIMNNPAYAYNFEFEGIDEKFVEGTLEILREYKTFNHIFPAFEPDRLFNKERALIREVSSAHKRGRKVLLYSMYNKAALVADRCKHVLSIGEETKELDVRIMPDTISGERILPWIEANSEADVVIASHLKLATGFNLTQFPTIIFYETGTKVREVQQAAKRSWRAVGQAHEVEVLFLAYEGSQAKILEIIGKKMRAAATIEGKKVEAGQIASDFDDDADFTAALNAIATSLKEENNANFEFDGASIEAGILRKKTEFELEYEAILEEVKGLKQEELSVVGEVEEAVEDKIVFDHSEEVSLLVPDDIKQNEELVSEDKILEEIGISVDETGQATFNF